MQPQKSLKVVSPIKNTGNLADYLEKLDAAGGNIHTFLIDYCGAQDRTSQEVLLYEIEGLLEDPANEKLKEEWFKAIRRSNKNRLLLIQSKMLKRLEQFENLSSSSSAADVSFCKLVFEMTGKSTDLKDPIESGAVKEQDEVDEFEAYMK